MKTITQLINHNSIYFIVGLTVVCFLLLILYIILSYQMHRLQKRANVFLGSRSDRRNLEALLTEQTEKTNAVAEKYEDILTLIDDLNERIRFCVQKVGVVRYNPFDSMGGDLSFSVALLDEQNNGVVLSTIHGRDASYTYAKPVIASGSSYTLSEEERKAIDNAIDENKLVKSYYD